MVAVVVAVWVAVVVVAVVAVVAVVMAAARRGGRGCSKRGYAGGLGVLTNSCKCGVDDLV